MAGLTLDSLIQPTEDIYSSIVPVYLLIWVAKLETSHVLQSNKNKSYRANSDRLSVSTPKIAQLQQCSRHRMLQSHTSIIKRISFGLNRS